ncbi:MAG: phosphate regulon sensor histidine kinase PhoR [Chromatiales bacterium]|jgi:two-component system phosphate regulon sensor histidine kinase PhoR
MQQDKQTLYENLKIELLRLAILTGLILLFGLLSGRWFIVTALFLGGYCLWQLRQVYYLERWMQGVDSLAISHLTGIWRHTADNLTRYRKAGRKRKRRISRLLQRFNTTLEVLPDATVVLDRKLKVEWLNAAAGRLLGITRKQIGNYIYDAIPIHKFQKYVRKAQFEMPLECVSPLNPGVELELNITPFGDDQYLLTAHDITEVKKVESIRREFIANVSHELRTPLTVIAGYLEMLENEDIEPYIKEAIGSSRRQTDRMQTLVSDLLMLSRLEMHDDAVLIEETVDVSKLLHGLQQDAIRLSDKAQHRILLEADASIGMRGNEAELSSAFSNLVYNAVLHTPAGTEITIRWKNTGEFLEMQVEDKGPGIETQHLARLTERFYRVDKARSRERGGTGLGLSICKHVVQRHGGEIKVNSEVGVGTTFSCIFPLNRLVELPTPK